VSEYYIGEIRLFGGTFAPVGWLDCDGRLVDISSYDTLFALIGTTYGGDGVTTFALPDLRGRVPVHQGARPGASQYVMGQLGGNESVTVTTPQLPAHTHPAVTASTGQVASPVGAILATAQSNQAGVRIYATTTATTTTLNPASIGPTGGSQPHNNMQPFLALRYIIATSGIFPPQS
jgi:microcystin-dependent protein